MKLNLSKAAVFRAGTKAVKVAKAFCVENSPAILAGVAIAGVVGTVAATFLATKKATRVYDNMVRQSEEEPTKTEVVKKTAKYFVPAAIFAGCTVAAVVGSHHMSGRKIAALSALLSMSEDSLKEYKAALSEEQKKEVSDKHAQKVVDQMNMQILEVNGITYTGTGDIIFIESQFHRPFAASKAFVAEAIAEFNNQLMFETTGSLNDLYECFGMHYGDAGYYLGWDVSHPVRYHLATTEYSGRPAFVIVYDTEPRHCYRDY